MPGKHPYSERYFEDYTAGEIVEFGDESVDEARIVNFAREYDPQAFHIDPVAAARSPFGGLVASGWQTAALMMRMMVDHFVSSHSLGSPGIDELRFLAPVRPGDRLRCRLTVLSTSPSKTKADRGSITQKVEVLNQAGVAVLSCIGRGFYRRRPETPKS